MSVYFGAVMTMPHLPGLHRCMAHTPPPVPGPTHIATAHRAGQTSTCSQSTCIDRLRGKGYHTTLSTGDLSPSVQGQLRLSWHTFACLPLHAAFTRGRGRGTPHCATNHGSRTQSHIHCSRSPATGHNCSPCFEQRAHCNTLPTNNRVNAAKSAVTPAAHACTSPATLRVCPSCSRRSVSNAR